MRRLTLAALLALLALPASAHAAFFGSEVIDGPNPDLVEVGDVDIARDGQGAVVYLRRDQGVNHVFVSRFADGGFLPPERVDNGLAPASSEPVVTASDDGRLAIAFINGGTLFTVIRAKDATGFGAPFGVAQGASHPSIDMSINGVTYVSFTNGADVRIARAERDNPAFAVLPQAADIVQTAPAGDTDRRASKIAVSADGTALVVWAERGSDGLNSVFARRIFDSRLSAAPQELSVTDFNGAAATDADSPEVDIEDDSSFAQVTFRQSTAAGPRILMRRLVGSLFDPPVQIDGGLPGSRGRVDINGKGDGIFAISGAGNEVAAGTLFDNKITGQTRMDPGNGLAPLTAPAVGENEDGAVAWIQGTSPADAAVHARAFDGVEFLNLTPDAILNKPEFGPVYPAGGMDASASRAGDVAVVFMQGGVADRRLVAGFFDKPPSRISGNNTTNLKRLTKFSWNPTVNLFGGTKYTILLDGKPLAETSETHYVPQRGQVRDGTHRWQIQISDRRGQAVVSRTRILRVDNTKPRLSWSVHHSGRIVTVRARAGDSRGRKPSGLSRIIVDFGPGRWHRVDHVRTYRYAHSGRYKIRIQAVDKAGNRNRKARRLRVR